MAGSASRGTLPSKRSPDRLWQIGIWLCFLVAFSPVLLDLTTHLRDNTWTRTILIFPWLVWIAASTETKQADESSAPKLIRSAWFWLCLGLGIELISIAGGSLRFGRVGMVIAAIGLCQGYGWTRCSIAMLFVWSLPLPRGVIDLVSPEFQIVLGKSVASLIPGLDFAIFDHVPSWITSGSRLPLSFTEQSASLVYGLAGVGWFYAVAKGRRIRDAILNTLRGAILAVPLGILILMMAGCLMRITNGNEVPRILLAQFGWVLVFGIGFVLSTKITRSPLRHPQREPAS